MSNSLIVQQGLNVAEMKSKIDSLIKAVDESEDARFAEMVIDNVKVARKLWEIKKQVDSIRDDLLILEIRCLTKIVNLGHEDVISSSLYKSAAIYFASKTSDEVVNAVRKHEHVKTAISLKKACVDAEWYRESYSNGLAFSSKQKHGKNLIKDDDYSEVYILSVQEAVDVLVKEFGNEGSDFTITELANAVLEGNSQYEGFEEGVKEICRKAVRSAKTVCVGDIKAPRFVTAMVDDGEVLWSRVPFENASLLQLKQMISLREDQLRQDIRALDNLKKIKEEAEGKGLSDPDLLIGIMTQEESR